MTSMFQSNQPNTISGTPVTKHYQWSAEDGTTGALPTLYRSPRIPFGQMFWPMFWAIIAAQLALIVVGAVAAGILFAVIVGPGGTDNAQAQQNLTSILQPVDVAP